MMSLPITNENRQAWNLKSGRSPWCCPEGLQQRQLPCFGQICMLEKRERGGAGIQSIEIKFVPQEGTWKLWPKFQNEIVDAVSGSLYSRLCSVFILVCPTRLCIIRSMAACSGLFGFVFCSASPALSLTVSLNGGVTIAYSVSGLFCQWMLSDLLSVPVCSALAVITDTLFRCFLFCFLFTLI